MSFIGYSWAVSPLTDETRYFGAGAVAGAGALTLVNTTAGANGVGYKVFFRSAGNSAARTWTIVGHKMGTRYGLATSETVTAPDTGTTTSTNYYDTITSITASGAMTGNQSVGVSGTILALPFTRIQGVQWVGTASAGTIVINRNSTTGTEILRINTPAAAAASDYVYPLGNGLPVGGSNAETDFALVSLTNVTYCTIICG